MFSTCVKVEGRHVRPGGCEEMKHKRGKLYEAVYYVDQATASQASGPVRRIGGNFHLQLLRAQHWAWARGCISVYQ